MTSWSSSLPRLAERALALLPALPWYGWAAVAGALLGATVLRTSPATAAPSPNEVPMPAGTPPVLKKGSTGPWVSYLQARLGLTATATFDGTTDAAVRAFQTQQGLTVDGVVGSQTWSALGVPATTPKPKPSTGSPGSKPPAPTGDVVTAPPATAPPPATSPTAVNPFGLSDDIGAREQQILSLIGAGKFEHDWVPLSWTKDGKNVQVLVSRRALALRDGGARTIVSVSFKNSQKVADMLGGVMLTTRASDEIARQAALRIDPLTRPWSQDGSMAKTYRLLEQSLGLDQKIGDFAGLVANEGKDWVLTRRWWTDADPNKRHHAANFGWYSSSAGSKSPGGEKVIQSIGLAHDMGHVDYSQLLRFMLDTMMIDGKPDTVASVLADPARSHLLQDEGGTIPQPRHPDL